MSTHCWTCLASFVPKRSDARYCCVACRVRAHRLAMAPAKRARERVKDAARHRLAYALRVQGDGRWCGDVCSYACCAQRWRV